ncbi:outer membrane beta-barrel protein [Bacteroides sp. 519]|uniref:outer membrane beta-barrel protein n=1 Tax=Bacteroides sp. 519 TaxID=2302937 RepID=UPI0013D2D5AD|nr:outer membrane beta-barrel protein [Bacteroides sp. 519]NDV57440.1 PorT family protein [Bacteroides sp. 519]
MSDNKELNHHRDYFSSYMQQQLKDHRLPPDDACWDEIEQRLQKKRQGLFIRKALWVAGAVAVFALLLLINIPTNKETTEMPSTYTEVVNEEIKTDVVTDDIVPQATPLPPSRGKYHAGNTQRTMETDIPTVQEKELLTDIPTVVDTKQVSVDDPKEERVVEEKKKKTELPVLPDRNASIKAKQKKSWQIGAGLLAMGNISMSSEDFVYHADSPNENDGSSSIPTPPDYTLELTPDNCDDISYNTPLSFGITARKRLGKNFSVETGLVYTYLSTNLKKNGGANSMKGKLGLHYLGIPVNLHIDLWNNPKWNIYASSGVMAEKGLRSVYTQHTYRANKEEKATVKTSISGLQWSINGSFGIAYRFYKEWSLYAEPRISYFFDNNQPISTRTDNPVNLGFGMGIRFDF